MEEDGLLPNNLSRLWYMFEVIRHSGMEWAAPKSEFHVPRLVQGDTEWPCPQDLEENLL